MSFELHHPGSVGEAVKLAHRLGDGARFLAGGTDLIVQIGKGKQTPAHVIDISALTELASIEERDDTIVIGALTTHKMIERHPSFEGALSALSEAARVVGGHQIRNRGTVGGNIANASPAADVVVALLVLDTMLELMGPDGVRTLRLDEFLLGPGRTARRPDEIITRLCFPRLPPASATCFLKAGRRRAMEISVACVAARLTWNAGGACQDVRISLGAVDSTIVRAHGAERLLAGQRASADLFTRAGKLAAQACHPIGDVRASAAYRARLVETLVPRALARCAERIEART